MEYRGKRIWALIGPKIKLKKSVSTLVFFDFRAISKLILNDYHQEKTQFQKFSPNLFRSMSVLLAQHLMRAYSSATGPETGWMGHVMGPPTLPPHPLMDPPHHPLPHPLGARGWSATTAHGPSTGRDLESLTFLTLILMCALT